MLHLKKIAAALTAASLVIAAPAAQAEGKIRIAEQFGVVYLLLFHDAVRDPLDRGSAGGRQPHPVAEPASGPRPRRTQQSPVRPAQRRQR